MIIDIVWVLTVDLYSEDWLILKGVKLSHVHDLKLVFYEIFMSFDHGVLYAVFWQILCSFWTSELIFYTLLTILVIWKFSVVISFFNFALKSVDDIQKALKITLEETIKESMVGFKLYSYGF